MKHAIHTIPLVVSFESGDECPFCDLERQTEQRSIRYFAGPGASYMEPEIREITNRTGFCRCHMKKLYDYGNPLGNALMIQTHMANVMEELHQQAQDPQIPQKRLFGKKKPAQKLPYWQHLQQRVDSCAICEQVESGMTRHFQVFFKLLKEPEFREMVCTCKGFCLRHFAQLLETAQEHLPPAHAQWFYSTVYPVMEDNLIRVKKDLDWMIARYDYRNAHAPVGNSGDALQRAMQKMDGLHPADPPYRKD